MEWFNYYGLIFVAVIMIPNVIFAATNKDGFKNLYKNDAAEKAEKIGRSGCFVFAMVNLPYLVKGFWFNGGFIVYLVCGSLLTLAYVAGWIIFRRENSVRRLLYLSVTPSVLFLTCGILSLNIPLIVCAAIFAPSHILISYKNAKESVKENAKAAADENSK